MVGDIQNVFSSFLAYLLSILSNTKHRSIDNVVIVMCVCPCDTTHHFQPVKDAAYVRCISVPVEVLCESRGDKNNEAWYMHKLITVNLLPAL